MALQAKQNDAQELTSGQASTMARNEQVVDVFTGTFWVLRDQYRVVRASTMSSDE